MMENQKTIFNYIDQVFTIYGMTMFIFMIFGFVVGDHASKYSSLFEFGSQGFSTATHLQVFLLAVITSVAQIAFFTDKWIKNLSMFVRNILFFGTLALTIIIFAILFEWFPIGNVKAQIGFVLSFAVCTTISIVISKLEEQAENKKMERALNKIKNK